MEHCGFFDARLEAGEYDRVYTADQHAQYFASFIGNGVFKYNPILGVVESTTPGLSVTLTPGQAWINGYWYKNDEDLELPIALPDESQPRIDAIAIRWNSITRDIKAVVIQGEPNSTPIAPTPVRDMVNYDLVLAHIRVNASALRIEDANITDTRLDFDICGFVYTLIDRGEEASLENRVNVLSNKVDTIFPIVYDSKIKGQEIKLAHPNIDLVVAQLNYSKDYGVSILKDYEYKRTLSGAKLSTFGRISNYAKVLYSLGNVFYIEKDSIITNLDGLAISIETVRGTSRSETYIKGSKNITDVFASQQGLQLVLSGLSGNPNISAIYYDSSEDKTFFLYNIANSAWWDYGVAGIGKDGIGLSFRYSPLYMNETIIGLSQHNQLLNTMLGV